MRVCVCVCVRVRVCVWCVCVLAPLKPDIGKKYFRAIHDRGGGGGEGGREEEFSGEGSTK